MLNFFFQFKNSKKSDSMKNEIFSTHPFFTRKKRPLNIDIAYRCALKCLRCGRQQVYRNKGLTVPGYDLSLSEFDKISDRFKSISFCGQYSDPIHHPQFIEILAMCKKKKVEAEVHVASSAKSKEWFVEAFKAYPDAQWIFGIDGLPEESHKYRVNQDGPKLYDIMLEAREYLVNKPHWQYIVFRYNQDHVEKAMEMAKERGLMFVKIRSSRWNVVGSDDLKPTKRV